MWGERAKDKSQNLSQLHTDYYNKVGHKYGLARGFSYDELSEEEKRGRKHKNKVVLEAERQAKVALDKVEKYAVLALIDKEELTIPFLNIKAPVQEAMNAVKKELAIPIPTIIVQKARQEAEAKRESMARQNRYIGVLDKFIHEGHEALSSFAKTDRVNFNEKESASIYYGIMASAVKHNIGLDSKASIESAAKSFLSGMSWKGFTDFKQECVTSWTKLFATNEVQFTDNAIDNFLAFVDHMSCSADTYVSLGGSNVCADQLTNWDGTQKVGLGAVLRKKTRGFSL